MKKISARWASAVALPSSLLLSLALTACGGGSDTPASSTTVPSAATLSASCSALPGTTVAGVRVTAAKRYEPNATLGTPGLCQVSGSMAPYLDIEVVLPDNWTGRYWQQGGGGLDGTITSALTLDTSGALTALSPVVTSKGAVYAASNGGNRADVAAQAAPTVWTNGTADGVTSGTQYAYASLAPTTAFAKTLANNFYGSRPTRSYFNGCSAGAREAYVVAQRMPNEFDGMVAGCETLDMPGVTARWLAAANTYGTPAALTTAQYKAAYAAAVTACDSLDGVADGVISNPDACTFRPQQLQCGVAGASTDASICLSAPQVATLDGLLNDLKSADGTVIYSKFNWTDFSGTVPIFGYFGGAFASLAFNDASWNTPAKQAAFNLDINYTGLAAGLVTVGMDPDDFAVASYVASGKKLLAYHDSADNFLSSNDHLRGFNAMLTTARTLGATDPNANARFFTIPGAFHAAGSSLSQVDWATAIINWVEAGTAPTQLTYAFRSGTTNRTMPICQYPAHAQYKGTGDVNAAANFTCTQ
jgi:hypothetical protein